MFTLHGKQKLSYLYLNKGYHKHTFNFWAKTESGNTSLKFHLNGKGYLSYLYLNKHHHKQHPSFSGSEVTTHMRVFSYSIPLIYTCTTSHLQSYNKNTWQYVDAFINQVGNNVLSDDSSNIRVQSRKIIHVHSILWKTESAQSKVTPRHTVADSRTKLICLGSMIITSSQTTPLSASFT